MEFELQIKICRNMRKANTVVLFPNWWLMTLFVWQCTNSEQVGWTIHFSVIQYTILDKSRPFLAFKHMLVFQSGIGLDSETILGKYERTKNNFFLFPRKKIEGQGLESCVARFAHKIHYKCCFSTRSNVTQTCHICMRNF